MASHSSLPAQLARYLRQRKELGGDPLFLSRLTREEVRTLLSEAGAPAVRTRSAAQAAAPALPAGYDDLRREALGCQRCPLARTRTQVVFSDGNPDARLMVVGEAPGEQEDLKGRAFVGPAGKLLDLLLASVGLDRASTAYICNVLKCRPPGNRNPLPAEIEACTPYLKQQIRIIAPEAILAVGLFSGQFLSGRQATLGKLRGEVYSYEGVPLVVTYHPAALLRNSGHTRATWEDLQLLRRIMDGA